MYNVQQNILNHLVVQWLNGGFIFGMWYLLIAQKLLLLNSCKGSLPKRGTISFSLFLARKGRGDLKWKRNQMENRWLHSPSTCTGSKSTFLDTYNRCCAGNVLNALPWHGNTFITSCFSGFTSFSILFSGHFKWVPACGRALTCSWHLVVVRRGAYVYR